MNAITRIQVEFGKPAAQVQIPVKYASATASHLRGVEMIVSRIRPGSVAKEAGSESRSIDVNRLITRIREMLRKPGAQ